MTAVALDNVAAVKHPNWCERGECVAEFPWAGIHRRVIGEVGEVTVSVDQAYGEDGWFEPVGVFVESHGLIALTEEQDPILAALVAEARQVVRGLAVEAFAS